jgi:SH3-like domain-containing protein
MAVRHVSYTLTLGLALVSSSSALLLSAPAAWGAEEDASALDSPQVENAKFQLVGRINTNQTPVRSGPSNNFYPTMKLDKGEEVTVVGKKYDWLKIIPPKGSFSYVPQAYVTRRGDGKIGRVNSSLNVRAGSSLNQMKTTVQTKLDEGQDVQIIEAADEYYKIVPPEGSYVYVNQQYVTPVGVKGGGPAAQPQQPEIANAKEPAGQQPQQPATGNETGTPPAQPGDTATPPVEQPVATGEQQPQGPSLTQTPDAPEPGTAVAGGGNKDDATPPGTSPAGPANIAEDFRQLESEFEAASKLPVPEQPIEDLTKRYQAVADAGKLTGMNKRLLDARLYALKVRGEAKNQMVEFRKSQAEMLDRRKSLEAEKTELAQRIKETEVSLFTAVGTLRISSLQQGAQTLYRLTDPNTGRTMVYVRSNDPKYAGMLNQFVGVRGDLVNDERLKMKTITPTDVQPVEQSKVNSGVIATITPPSLMPTTTTQVDQGEAQ